MTRKRPTFATLLLTFLFSIGTGCSSAHQPAGRPPDAHSGSTRAETHHPSVTNCAAPVIVYVGSAATEVGSCAGRFAMSPTQLDLKIGDSMQVELLKDANGQAGVDPPTQTKGLSVLQADTVAPNTYHARTRGSAEFLERSAYCPAGHRECVILVVTVG